MQRFTRKEKSRRLKSYRCVEHQFSQDTRQYGFFLYSETTAETSFYGLVEAAQVSKSKKKIILFLKNRATLTKSLQELLAVKYVLKSSYKDAELRT
jgi:amidophosphoribosyltransferase